MTKRPTNQPPKEEPRTLEEIHWELSNCLQNRSAGRLRIGRLLNEAQDVANHGEWLPFLRRLRIEERSARRDMKCAKWATEWTGKSDKLSDFSLGMITSQAIYELAGGQYADDVVERVIFAARYRHVGIADVKSIAKVADKATILREIRRELKIQNDMEVAEELAQAQAKGFDTVEAHQAAIKADKKEARKRKRQQKAAADQAVTERAQAEADCEAERDPNLPPATEPTTASSASNHIGTFEKAVQMLTTLTSKPLATFGVAKVSPDDLDRIARFLMDVVAQRKRIAA
jgi:hypothetical protein